jgi:hypothetical protein
MDKKSVTTVILLIFLIFVGFGDSFLPQPLKEISLTTRISINNFFVSLFPTWRMKTNPNQNTNKAIDEMESTKKK